ncbi:uncharacterized protein RHOBADRAFT_42263 [Rhodotorula graminis WP1]|uniref:Uncharacterized protein n=1 Tax=Rhodotorula graminis (strain WP1) TaxID=578459 RepID=A0A194S9A6_RHOGW|nr:uncharacterized protein RHOBADRAFT_42263 [Rhodotorula graminis WP1]KPV77050.1 hypothetical protein RHOBADRAFT_42263 [Rhodotorula graminis WP1]
MATATRASDGRRDGPASARGGGGGAPRAGAAPAYLDDDEGGSAPGPEADSDSDDASSTTSSSSSWDFEREAHEAQLQWDESVRQLQALVNLVAVPWVSRYFGRKWAYSLFERYLDIGLGKRFWLGPLAQYAPVAWR